MTPRTLTSPLHIRGDVPGLLAQGMPCIVEHGPGGFPPLRGMVLRQLADPVTPLVEVAFLAPKVGMEDGIGVWSPSELRIDWSSPLAVYAAFHWLSTHGHPCLWMLPTLHGGRTASWTQAAILVSVSVARVVAGMGPVADLVRAYGIPTNTRMSMDRIGQSAVYWTATETDRDHFVAPTRLGPDVKATPDHPGWLYTPPIGLTSWGYEVGQAAVDRINACALADGAALLGDDGAVTVGVSDEP